MRKTAVVNCICKCLLSISALAVATAFCVGVFRGDQNFNLLISSVQEILSNESSEIEDEAYNEVEEENNDLEDTEFYTEDTIDDASTNEASFDELSYFSLASTDIDDDENVYELIGNDVEDIDDLQNDDSVIEEITDDNNEASILEDNNALSWSDFIMQLVSCLNCDITTLSQPVNALDSSFATNIQSLKVVVSSGKITCIEVSLALSENNDTAEDLTDVIDAEQSSIAITLETADDIQTIKLTSTVA